MINWLLKTTANGTDTELLKKHTELHIVPIVPNITKNLIRLNKYPAGLIFAHIAAISILADKLKKNLQEDIDKVPPDSATYNIRG